LSRRQQARSFWTSRLDLSTESCVWLARLYFIFIFSVMYLRQ
jgi:hypothetical protein